MRILVDGHNVIGALRIRGRTHEEAREKLLRFVGAVTADATVYFDARNAPEGTVSVRRQFGVHVVYCRHEEADDRILEAVRKADVPAALIVVTNDREVRGRASNLGARGMKVQEFFGPGPAPEGGSEDPRPTPRRIRFKPKDFGLPDEVDLDDPDID